MSRTPEALVFDFDGVLADTEPLYWRSWAELLEPYGVVLSWEDYERYGRGATDEQMLVTLPELAEHRHLIPALKQQTRHRQQQVGLWCAEQSPICASSIAMLHELGGFRVGLVTSSHRFEVEPILRDAGVYECFDSLVYGEDVQLHKPDPAPYLLIRDRLGIKTGVAFEDSDQGMASAAAAAFTAVRIVDPGELANVVRQTLNRS